MYKQSLCFMHTTAGNHCFNFTLPSCVIPGSAKASISVTGETNTGVYLHMYMHVIVPTHYTYMYIQCSFTRPAQRGGQGGSMAYPTSRRSLFPTAHATSTYMYVQLVVGDRL